MRTFTSYLLSILMTAVFPLVPVVVHAQTVAVTGSATVGAGVTVTNSNTSTSTQSTDSQTIDARVGANANEIMPILITRGSAEAGLRADENDTSAAATLRAHAALIARDDANVKAIALASDKVTLTYRTPAELFGFITIHVPVKVSIDASGSTTVSYPWYRFLMATDQAGLDVRAKAVADQHVSAEVKTAAQFSTDTETRIIDSLHAMLKSEAGASMSADTE